MKGLGLSLTKQNFVDEGAPQEAYWVGDGVNDYISGTASSPYIWSDVGTQDLSFSMWVRIDSSTKKNQQLLSISDSDSNNQNIIAIYYQANVNRLVFRQKFYAATHDKQIPLHSNSSTTGISNSTTGWTSGQRGNTNDDGFVNITITHDASDKTLSGINFYWNGTLINGGSSGSLHTGNRPNWNPKSLGLGENITSTNPSAGVLGGALDEVKIYGDVLTQSEVTTIYNSGVPATAATTHSASLITEWSLRGVVTDLNSEFTSTNNGGTYGSY